VTARVEAAVTPLEGAPFDLFDRRYSTSWEAAMGKFRDNVTNIEEVISISLYLSIDRSIYN